MYYLIIITEKKQCVTNDILTNEGLNIVSKF